MVVFIESDFDEIVDLILPDIEASGQVVLFLGAGISDEVQGVGGVEELVHPLVGDFDGDVVVGEGIEVLLGVEEFEDIGVGEAHHAHIGASSEGALLDGVGGFGEYFPEADGPGGFAAAGGDIVAGGAELIEGEAGAAAGFLDDSGVLDGVEDTVDAVRDGQDETGAEHAHGTTGVHECGAVG